MPRRAERYTTGVVRSVSNTIARTDTTAKVLFTLPKGARLLYWMIEGAVASNAVTTATLNVGVTGTPAKFISAYDVKAAATGVGANVPKSLNGGVQAGVTEVKGVYAETGTASTTGGPWTVTAFYEA